MFKKRAEYLTKYPVKKHALLFLEAYEYVTKLEKYFPAIQFEDANTGILVKIEGLNIKVETFEEFFIVAEVFIDNDYNFLNNEKSIVVDIGMNIGIASLYFSKMNNVEKIYAFEPIKDTFENALENFALNPNYSTKIIPHNFGLGKNTRNETFMFDKNVKGNTGVRGKKSASYQLSTSKETREVVIENIAAVFTNIADENEKTTIVFKIDCEGAEYEIFQKLNEEQLISKAQIYMIEWHDEGSEVLEKILVDNNFVVFSRKLAVNSGMLYAYNKNK